MHSFFIEIPYFRKQGMRYSGIAGTLVFVQLKTCLAEFIEATKYQLLIFPHNPVSLSIINC